MEFKKFEDEGDNENKKQGDNTNSYLGGNTDSGKADDVRLERLDFEFRRNPLQTWFRMMFPHLNFATLSVAIAVVIALVFILELLLWRNNEWKCLLYSLGSNFTPAIKRGHIQRLFFPDFLHNDWARLIWNMFVFLSVGCNAEYYLKIVPYLILVVASILLGNLFGAGFRYDICNESVGATPVIMAILAFELLWFIFNWNKMGRSKWLFVIHFSTIFLTTLLSSWASGSGQDFWGNFGGFMAGL